MIDPIFLVEAAINGILLGGVLALLALGLNLIFGVLDIVWIAYVDLVMLCMYAIYYFNAAFGWPIWAAGLVSLALGALLGVAVHLLIISPILTSAPINQLLATGGLLFFLQSFATFLWTTDHKTVRLSLPSYEVAGIFLPATRIIPFAISILAVIVLYLFLTRTYIGTAIRAVSQDRDAMALMGANPQRIYIVTSAVGGLMAGLAGALLLRRAVRAAHLHGVRAGRSGKYGGRLHRLLHHERDHRHRGRGDLHRDGLCHRLRALHHHAVRAAGRH